MFLFFPLDAQILTPKVELNSNRKKFVKGNSVLLLFCPGKHTIWTNCIENASHLSFYLLDLIFLAHFGHTPHFSAVWKLNCQFLTSSFAKCVFTGSFFLSFLFAFRVCSVFSAFVFYSLSLWPASGHLWPTWPFPTQWGPSGCFTKFNSQSNFNFDEKYFLPLLSFKLQPTVDRFHIQIGPSLFVWKELPNLKSEELILTLI